MSRSGAPINTIQVQKDQSRNEILARMLVAIEGLSGGVIPNVRSVTGDTSVRITDGIIEVDTTGGVRTVTYDPTLAIGKIVYIVRTGSGGNVLNLSDGTSIVATLINAPNGAFFQFYAVYSNGSALRILQQTG